LRPSVNWPQLPSRVSPGCKEEKPFTAKIAKKIRKDREANPQRSGSKSAKIAKQIRKDREATSMPWSSIFELVFFAILAAVLRELRG
jgi:hypothetical protein